MAIPQLKGSTSVIAIPKLFYEMLVWNRNFFWFPQLQVRNFRASFPQFSAYIWPWNPVDSWKKNWREKISCNCPYKASFWFPEKQTVLKIFLVDFYNHPELRKRYQKAEFAGGCGELRNCGSQILRVRQPASLFPRCLCSYHRYSHIFFFLSYNISIWTDNATTLYFVQPIAKQPYATLVSSLGASYLLCLSVLLWINYFYKNFESPQLQFRNFF